MKKTITLVFLALLPLLASAYDAEIDGIYYNINAETKEAEVTYGSSEYTGSVIIPKIITYKGATHSVTSIGSGAFYGCSGLTAVTIPNSVTSIGISAFRECSRLTSVTIPNSVTTIGDYAFSECSGLMEVTIPNSVTSIGERPFFGCVGLIAIDVESGNTRYDSRDNCYAIIETSTNTLIYGCKNTIIPNSVTEIGNYAFSYCIGLREVTIPNSVTTIGEHTFDQCSGLTEVTIPNSVTSIGDDAFFRCSELTSVTIGSGVKRIGGKAFYQCPKLTDVYCYAGTVPNGYSAFQSTDIADATLYVPEAAVAAYKASTVWNGFGTIKTLSVDIPETQKCATPTVSYSDGQFYFSCETEGVEYVYNITPPAAKAGNGNTIGMLTTYIVTVYATKSGYENSDVATKEINVSSAGAGGIRGDVNGDGTVSMPDAMFIVNKVLNGKFPDE